MLENVAHGATLLLNCPYAEPEAWAHLPHTIQEGILANGLRVYIIDGDSVARASGMANRVNTVMQTCFFALSGVLPQADAVERIKTAIQKTYGKRGEAVVRQNFAAVDAALAQMHALRVPSRESATMDQRPTRETVAANAPAFVRHVTAAMIAGHGDLLPVSAIPIDGTYPSATAQWEKRNLADDVPVWDSDLCVQCGKCVLVCPHAVIRGKVYDTAELDGAPAAFKHADARWKELPGMQYTLQVAVEDCTGCMLCVEACPVKDKSNSGRKAINMAPIGPLREAEQGNWAFFQKLPDTVQHDRARPERNLPFTNVKNIQLLRPLFEFSGACAGCGETPYLKLLSQLFGERAIIANATGCSSIYGGNLPTTPWAVDTNGRGPAWSNSLFEDNAEFGLGMRLSIDMQADYARRLVSELRDIVGAARADALLQAEQMTAAGIAEQRDRVAELKRTLQTLPANARTLDLLSLADVLVDRSMWIVGGDGWAYDIGFGGLDHVLASGRNVNVLVLDTEVYSNTGGQSSKATPLGAVAKFATSGKTTPKKDLGRLAMAYGDVYVAQVAMGASDSQTVRAFLEAEAHPGPSLIIAYSHCIAHGIDMTKGMHQQKLAVDCGYWPLYRQNPALRALGKNPMQLDSHAPRIPFKDYAGTEARYRVLEQTDPIASEAFMAEAQRQINARWKTLEAMAA